VSLALLKIFNSCPGLNPSLDLIVTPGFNHLKDPPIIENMDLAFYLARLSIDMRMYPHKNDPE